MSQLSGDPECMPGTVVQAGTAVLRTMQSPCYRMDAEIQACGCAALCSVLTNSEGKAMVIKEGGQVFPFIPRPASPHTNTHRGWFQVAKPVFPFCLATVPPMSAGCKVDAGVGPKQPSTRMPPARCGDRLPPPGTHPPRYPPP